MRRQCQEAFTLVELLVVVTIVGLLVALLMPGLTTAWDAAQMTQCKRNLNSLFQAAGVRRADTGQMLYVSDRSWAGMLKPYLEARREVFVCPKALAVGGSRASPGGGFTPVPEEETQGGSEGGGGSGGSGGETTNPWGEGGTGHGGDPTRPRDYGVDIGFDVYSDASFTNLLWTVGLESEWSDARKLGENEWEYQIEDQGYMGGGDNDRRDIGVSVKYDEYNRPRSLRIIQPKGGSQGYRFDLMVDGEMVVHNIDQHRGEIIEFEVEDFVAEGGGGGGSGATGGTGGGSGGGTSGGSGGSGGTGGTTTVAVLPTPCDYGMSKGWYTATHTQVSRVDGKLFFICDFPEKLVDFTDTTYKGDWDKYFIEDVEEWQETWGYEGANVAKYQALRHFGQANMLFCDGHIETLGPEDLYWTNRLWQYGRN